MLKPDIDQNAEILGRYYNELTYDMPHGLWLDIINQFKNEGGSVLDIGCGTGRLTRQLDFNMKYGIDLSDSMLETARKGDDNIVFLKKDMRNFKIHEQFDMIVATVDVLNYLKDEEEFIGTLKNIHEHLKEDGVFIFDLHSKYKMENDFNDMLYTDDTEHITYIWQAFQGDDPLSVIHEMTYFVKDDDDLYHRVDEVYNQRTYEHKAVIKMIEQAGLYVDIAFSDFDVNNPVTHVCDRIFYVVKKAL